MSFHPSLSLIKAQCENIIIANMINAMFISCKILIPHPLKRSKGFVVGGRALFPLCCCNNTQSSFQSFLNKIYLKQFPQAVYQTQTSIAILQ
jgi:hypothetical protein